MKGIYYYIDLNNGDVVYIGKDSNIHKNIRYKAHMIPSQYDTQPFNRIIQNNPDRYEYGVFVEGNFTPKLLCWLEKKYIEKYNPKFNFTKGGDGLGGFKHSEETKKKMSEAQMGEKNHQYGKHATEDTKLKLSKAKNTTGYYGVYLQKNNAYVQGFCYVYQYYKNGKRKRLSSVDLNTLKDKVLNKNLLWKRIT